MKRKILLIFILGFSLFAKSQSDISIYTFDTNKVINYSDAFDIYIDGCLDNNGFCKKKASMTYFSFIDWKKLQETIEDIHVTNVTLFPTKEILMNQVSSVRVAFIDTVDIKQLGISFPKVNVIYIVSVPVFEFGDDANLPYLEKLQVMFCGATITPKFAQNSNLKSISIDGFGKASKNLLESIWSFKKLESLYLSQKIDCFVPAIFGSAHCIKSVGFHVGKNICNTNFFDVISTFDNLEFLSISSDGTVKNFNLMKFNKQLDTLYLTNCIKELPTSVYALVDLKCLSIADNDFKKIDFDFSKFTLLKTLNLSSNKLENIESDLKKLTSLETLKLSKNKFKQIPIGVYELDQLKYLDVSNNKIIEITDDIEKMKSLEVLDISNNKIECISPKIKNLTKLKKIKIARSEYPKMKEKYSYLLPLCEFEPLRAWNIHYL